MSAGKKQHRGSGPPRSDGQFRVIGGQWRGRRFSFSALAGVRPTGDRIRETLFNWLQPCIEGARCLDLFAGSGSLGIEALSRGAREVVFVDLKARLLSDIEMHLEVLGCVQQASFHCMDAAAYLKGKDESFDVVFLDPPFGSGVLPELCQMLDSGRWLVPSARVYIECERNTTPVLPDGWAMLRSAKAGNVGYHLASGPAGP